MFDFFSPIDQIRRISSRKAEKNISESYDYLMNDFRAVASILESYCPLEVIKLSLWDERKVLSEKKKDPLLRARAVLLPVILQSVLQSTLFQRGGKEGSISQKDWSRLISLGDDTLRRIIRIIDNRTSLFLSSSDADDADGEKYRCIIARYLIPDAVTSDSLRASSDTLRSLLEEKEDIEEKIGTDPLSLALNIENIAKRGLAGIDDLCRRVQQYSDEYSLAAAQMSDSLKGMSEDEVYRTITKKNGWEGRAENLAAERDGYDMFLISSSSSLDESVYDNFTADPGKLDILSFLKMGYWISMRYPVFRYDGLQYTFVGKHMPSFIALSSSLKRRKAAQKSVQAIFFRTGIDTYTYDGNQVDISVLPSFYDSNIFMKDESYFDTKKIWFDEKSVKTGYGHSRLVVDPDMEEEMTHDGETLVISSLMMFRATIDRAKKKELITALLGELEFPAETEEYRVIDEDEIDRGEAPVFDDDSDDTITDEYEYETEEDETEKDIPDVPIVEYEKKNDRNIAEEEEKYALTDEIIRRDEEIEKEEEKFESELDDDIFDDTEEEERLDEIGEKTESDYYEEVDADEIHAESEESTDEAEEDSSDSDGDVQLDFFSLLDEEEEKVIDDELEKEDEEEFREEEEKAEELDTEEASDSESAAELPPDTGAAAETVCGEDIPLDDEVPGELPHFEEDEEDVASDAVNAFSDEEVISEEDIPLDDEDEESSEAAGEDVTLDDEEMEELPHVDEEDEDVISEEDIPLDDDEEETEESSGSSDDSVNEENEVPDEESVSEEDVPLDDEEELPPSDDTEESSSEEKAADTEDEAVSGEDKETAEPGEEIISEEDIPLDDEEAEELPLTGDSSESAADSGNSEVSEEASQPEESETDVETVIGEDAPEAEPEEDEVPEEEIISEEDVPLDEEELPQSDNPEESSPDGEENVAAEDGEEDEIAPEEEIISREDVSSEDAEEENSGEESVSEEYETDEETDAEQKKEETSPADETARVSEEVQKETAEEAEEQSACIEKSQDKPLDVNSWMKDFLGDYSDDEESTSSEEETTSAESDDEDKTLEIEDDSFVLPRDGRIEGKLEEKEETEEENTENGEASAEAERKEESPSVQNEEKAQSFASFFLDGVENAEEAENEEEEKRQVLSMEELEGDESPLPLVTDEPVNEEESREEEIGAEGLIYDIYKKLSPSSVFASFVRSSDSETLEELENVIQNCWNRMQGDGKDKLFNVADYSFSILLSRNNIRDDLRLAELLNNAGGVMYSRGENEWTAIILYINSDYILDGAIEKTITKDSFSPSDWKRVTYIGEQMKKR